MHRNILITSSNFPKGSAAANYLNQFCRGVVESGSVIEVYLLKGYFLGGRKSNDSRTNLTDYGVRYTYLTFINRSSNKILKITADIIGIFTLSWLLIRCLKDRKRLKIFGYNNELHHSLLLTIFCKLTGLKVITFVPEYYDISEFSGNLFHKLRWYSFLMNFHYVNRLSYRLIAFSDYIRNRYIEKNYPENRILVQPNLTDFGYWKSDGDEIRFTIGYSGTPYKKDGINDLLSAISILKRKNFPVNAVVIGDVVNEKSIIPSLAAYCRELGIEESVTFTGLVPLNEVKIWLHKCHILAITRPCIVQTMAGFPTKIGEYFACRKVVLSTRIGDVGQYFRDREEIVFAECGNPQSIADNIEWILNNQEECRKIALKGYNRARELLNYQSKVPEILNFVNKS